MKFFDEQVNVAVMAGASGIGREVVKAYLNNGASVFVCDESDEFINLFRKDFPKVFIRQVDVAEFEQVKGFFSELSNEIDHLDILINKAGITGPTALLEDADPRFWSRTMDVNVTGMFHCCREAIPLLKKSKAGSIINMASNAAYYGFPYRSAYAASKWAVIGLTKTLAMELGKDNIRVNAICPGSVTGDRIQRVIEAEAKEKGVTNEEVERLYVKQVSLKTFIDPEDVANMCLYLTSKMGRFISGQAMGLDGHTEGLSTEI